MTDQFPSFGQMAELYTVEQDWLSEEFLVKINAHKYLLLTDELDLIYRSLATTKKAVITSSILARKLSLVLHYFQLIFY